MDVRIVKVKPESVNDQGDAILPIEIDGVEYPLTKLRLADLAETEAYLRGKAISQMLNGTRMFPVTEQAKGEALASIVQKEYPLSKLIDDQEGRLRMLYLSLHRGGSKVTWDWCRDNITVDLMTELSRLLMWISGLIGVGSDDEANPTMPSGEASTRDGKNA